MTLSRSVNNVTGNSDLLLISRGIAAVSVVFWHAVGYLGQYPFWLNIPGRTAVWLFFGISGYVIAYGFIHRRYSLSALDVKDFYVNRFLRIYPIFLFLSIVAWAIEFVATGENPIPVSDIPAQIFAFQFNHDYRLNGVFWTLGIEIHFYLLAPLLLMPFLQKERHWYFWFPIIIYVTVLIWIVFSYLELGWSLDGRNIVACLPHFLTGIFGCKMVVSLSKSTRQFWLSLLGAIALLIITNYIYHYAPKYYWTPIGIILIDGAILLLIVAHASWSGSSSISISAMTTIGLLSYGIYAWHGFWMKAIPGIFMDNIVLLLPVSIACAYVSYRIIETPALRLRRSHVASA